MADANSVQPGLAALTATGWDVVEPNEGGRFGSVGVLTASQTTAVQALVSGAGVVSATFGSSAAATANRVALQAALDAGGLVTLRGPAGSVCWVDASLRIGGDTTLDCGDVEIKATGVGVSNLLTSKAYVDAGTTVTVAWSSGLTATVTWTAHGLTTDDLAWLNRADQGQFCGVFSIASVSDANTFVVNLRRLPSTTATGTIIGRRAHKKVRVYGGVWNYNSTGGNTGTGAGANAIILAGIQDLEVKNIKGKDTLKYLVTLGAVSQYDVDGAGGDNLNSDCCKVYGPAFGGRVRNLFGTCGDDMFSAQTKEPAAFVAQDFCHGDILGLQIERIGGKTTTSAAVLYASTFGVIDGVTISNVTAASAAGSIRLETIYPSGTNEISNVTINDLVGAGQFHGIVLGNAANPLSVKNLVVNNPTMRSASNSGRLIAASGTAVTADLTVRGGYLTGIESLVNQGSGSTIKAAFDKTVIGTSFVAFRAGASGTLEVTLRDVTFESSPSSAFFNNNAGTPAIRLRVDGRVVVPAAPVITFTGTPTVTIEGVAALSLASLTTSVVPVVNGPNITADVTVVARTAGAQLYNTNAAAGTLAAAGLVSCQGTAANSWRLAGDPTLRY